MPLELHQIYLGDYDINDYTTADVVHMRLLYQFHCCLDKSNSSPENLKMHNCLKTQKLSSMELSRMFYAFGTRNGEDMKEIALEAALYLAFGSFEIEVIDQLREQPSARRLRKMLHSEVVKWHRS
jgi:hypothetical protein